MEKNINPDSPAYRKDLRKENDLLKMKLTAEFGMQHSESKMDEELENEWLNYIYSFEKSYAESKRVKIYDFIGKPEFKKFDELAENEVESELERLYELLQKNNIILDCICDYKDDVIYKFITEELFQEETDDIRIDGLNHCYLYEEFHPNHEYDLKNNTEELFTKIYDGKWNEEFDNYSLYDELILNSTEISKAGFEKHISDFHKSNSYFKTDSIKFDNIVFNLQSGKAEASGTVILKISDNFNIQKKYNEDFKLNFELNEIGYWEISCIEFEPLLEERF